MKYYPLTTYTLISHFVPNITMGMYLQSVVYTHLIPYTGAPILACVSKGVPGIFMDCHMMVAQPEKVQIIFKSTNNPR